MRHTIITCLLLTAALFSSSFRTGSSGEKVTLIITVTVTDFATWKKAFDAGASVREQSGIRVLQVCNDTEDERRVVVIEEADDLQQAKDFVALLKKRQKPGAAALDLRLLRQQEQ